MQLCALDSNDTLVFAAKALKQTDYQCLECRETVRLRSGLFRQPHFFHIQPNGKCRLHAKGLPHLMVQYHLKNLLPEGEVEIECRFPSIGRIADVAWHAKKIVYEIQYSQITAEEVLARNSAYASAGYQVVWILHEHRYNQTQLSAAEDVLSGSPHYYTNMDEHGQGVIYEQFSCVERGFRIFRLPRLPIDPSLPYETKEFGPLPEINLPKKIHRRVWEWKYGFSGDMLDRLHRHGKGADNDDSLERKLVRMIGAIRDGEIFGSVVFNFEFLKAIFCRWVVHPYKIFLRFMLERACR